MNVIYKIQMYTLVVLLLPSGGEIEESLWMQFIKSRCILHMLEKIQKITHDFTLPLAQNSEFLARGDDGVLLLLV